MDCVDQGNNRHNQLPPISQRDQIPTDKVILQKWLKAGFVENKRLFPTEAGTPQGGIISPVLANMVLDGLENLLETNFPPLDKYNNYGEKGKRSSKKLPKPKVHLVRYADDFIITANSKELLENEILPLVTQFMAERGLELSKEKTKITHIEEGFDFLGWNIRKYDGTLLTMPSKKNVHAFLSKIRETIKNNKSVKQSYLIKMLNPMIRGWVNYHQCSVAKKTFSYVDREIFKALWQWANRRHPKKGKRWVRAKYFNTVGNRKWVFSTLDGKNQVKLVCAAETKIIRHIKIQGDANPYDSKSDEYFETRTAYKMSKSLKGRKDLMTLWRRQRGKCLICRERIVPGEEWAIHHTQARTKGGSDSNSNKMLIHGNCHRQYHAVNGLETGPFTRAS